ncbi:MAG TPA: histidine ammonia-lyase [Casimicrobiaceae bacterium]|nr:histidine ammonia-lyase [Casimicrobiaceae bacterium]
MTVQLSPGRLTLQSLRVAWRGPLAIALPDAARERVEAAAKVVAELATEGRVVYGVNTGFGLLARTRIDAARLSELQRALVLSHSAGTGAPLEDAVVRLALVLKVASLGRGFSGVRYEVVDALVRLVNARVLPVIPSQGSVGASGDLAPLAHLAGVLIGEGEARIDGATLSAAVALQRAGLAPLTLGPKEGLALVNGTQVSTALALAGLFAAERVLASSLVSGALSVDACLGSDTPFDERIQALRASRGQADVASVLRRLLVGSAIRASHRDCPRVQDPYSLRCQPQVAGACLDAMRHAGGVLLTEANAVSDNPLVFAGAREVLSGGNFHAEAVALAADHLALAIAEIGALAERRVALLMDANLSGLPPFLVRDGGVNSGFMIAQVTAAALASENKALASPRSVDSLPTSANQEDHVSMATNAALRLAPMVSNAGAIVAIELLAAAQGVELRAPLATSGILQRAIARVRREAAFWERDRAFAPDLARVKALVEAGELSELTGELLATDDGSSAARDNA